MIIGPNCASRVAPMMTSRPFMTICCTDTPKMLALGMNFRARETIC